MQKIPVQRNFPKSGSPEWLYKALVSNAFVKLILLRPSLKTLIFFFLIAWSAPLSQRSDQPKLSVCNKKIKISIRPSAVVGRTHERTRDNPRYTLMPINAETTAEPRSTPLCRLGSHRTQ